MALERKLAKMISPEKKTKSYTARATVVRVEDDMAWVRIEGAAEGSETPAAISTGVRIGDSVQVNVSTNGTTVVGNYTSPATDDKRAIAAQKTANVASETATQAATDASIAKSAADQAIADAATAHEKAEEAAVEADNARASAQLARAEATITKQAVESAQGDADTAEKAARKSLSNLLTTEKAAELAQTVSVELSDFLDDVNDDDAIIYKASDGVHITDSNGNSRAVYGATGTDYLNDSLTSVAHYGSDGARIGKEEETRITVSGNEINFFNDSNENGMRFRINEKGTAQMTLTNTNTNRKGYIYQQKSGLNTGVQTSSGSVLWTSLDDGTDSYDAGFYLGLGGTIFGKILTDGTTNLVPSGIFKKQVFTKAYTVSKQSGKAIEVTAMALTGYTFVGWVGIATGNGNIGVGAHSEYNIYVINPTTASVSATLSATALYVKRSCIS